MDNEALNVNKEHKKHYSEEKYELYFDYNNSYSFGNMIKEINNNRTYQLKSEGYNRNNNNFNHNCYNNYSGNEYNYNSFNKSFNEIQSTKINSSFNSSSLNEYIQQKKEAFIKISNSMNKIINKHKNNYYNKEEDNIEINTDKNSNYDYNKDKNLNQIVDHLIKAYSKDELKYIKDKINNKVDEDEEEPQPEKLYIYPNQNKKNKINLKLSSESPSFLKINNKNNLKVNNNHINKNITNNKTQFFKKINKNINYKPIKINTKNISNKKNAKSNNNYIHKPENNTFLLNKTNIFKNNNHNIKFKPEFYTYIKCKTSFECIDNFLKRQKSYNKYISTKKINLKNNKNNIENKSNTFIPNTTFTSNSKYSIKLQAKRFKESKNDKNKRMLYDTMKLRKEKNNILILKHNKSFSFNPNINKYKNKDNKDLTMKKALTKKNSKNNVNENKNKELTPVKYINHKFDYVKSIYKNDGELFKRIKEQSEKKVKKYEKLKTEYDKEKLEGCTFKPDMSKTYYKNLSYIDKYNKENTNKKNKRKNKNDNSNEKDNKNFTYVDFYQYKKKAKKNDKKNKSKDIEKIGSLSPIVISKKITKNISSDKLTNDNDNFLIMHKLLLHNKPDN